MTSDGSAELNIRDVLPEELDTAAKVMKAAYLEYSASLSPEAWAAYAGNIVDVRGRLNNSALIVAESGHQIVGAVTFYPDGSRYGREGWPPGWAGIRLLAVHPEHRGRGVARALMLECFRRCRDLGTTTMGLHSTELMLVAREMYLRMGFVRVPEYDFHPSEGTVVMAYRLDL